MKIFKMHHKGDDEFNRFVRGQLNKVDVDPSRADELMGEMQFPVAVEPSERAGSFWKRNRKYLSLLILLIFISGAVWLVLDKKAASSKNEGTTQTNIQPVDNSKPGTAKEVEEKGNDVANTTTVTKQEPGKDIEKITIPGKANNALKRNNDGRNIDASGAVITLQDASPPPLIIKDTMQAKSPVKPPPVSKDTIHIIW